MSSSAPVQTRWRLVAILAAMAWLLPGCVAVDAPDPTLAPDVDESIVGALGTSHTEMSVIEFKDDGTFEARDSCSFSGRWSEATGRVALTVLAGTSTPCTEVPNLDRAQNAEMSSGKLTLFDSSGRELVQLDRLGR